MAGQGREEQVERYDSMEVPETSNVESLSYRWLVNLEPPPVGSFRGLFDEAAFIEMDPAMPPSRRFSVTSFSPDFEFDTPASWKTSIAVVHADEIFAEGYVLPLIFECGASGSDLPRERDTQRAETVVDSPGSGEGIASSSFESRPRLPKQIFLRHLNFLKLFYRIFRRQRLSSRQRYVDKQGLGMRNWVYPEDSAFSADDGRESSFSECSIYEAVLHCKKSIGRETGEETA